MTLGQKIAAGAFVVASLSWPEIGLASGPIGTARAQAPDPGRLEPLAELATGHLLGCCEVRVALDGDLAVVGTTDGVAYVYGRTERGWMQEAVLEPSDVALANGSGVSVTVSGHRVLLGIWTGVGYLFVREAGGWIEEARLQPPTRPASRSWVFGASVALADDVALVGVDGDLPYVFEREQSAWHLVSGLPLPDDVWVHGGGQSVALVEGLALVGATDGAVYVFACHGTVWESGGRLSVRTADGRDGGFGISVALDDDTALVSAPYTGVEGSTLGGVAHVFSRREGTWTHESVLQAPEGSPEARLGESVAVDGELALVGAFSRDQLGAVYVFGRHSGVWSLQQRLMPDHRDDVWFGTSVAVSRGTALIGAVRSKGGGRENRSAVAHVMGVASATGRGAGR